MTALARLYRRLTDDRSDFLPAAFAGCAVVIMVLVYGNPAAAAATTDPFPLMYWWWHVWLGGG